jgi:hypothetical protein
LKFETIRRAGKNNYLRLILEMSKVRLKRSVEWAHVRVNGGSRDKTQLF